jgi:hypothetical protein
MDGNDDAMSSAARALCTLHDDDHPPIIDCDSVLERIFGLEGIIDHDVETSTYSALYNTGIAHCHIGQFGNGCIEGRLVRYVPLASEDLADVNISLGIVREMARLQTNVILLPGGMRDVNYDGFPKSVITFLNEMENTGWGPLLLHHGCDNSRQKDGGGRMWKG